MPRGVGFGQGAVVQDVRDCQAVWRRGGGQTRGRGRAVAALEACQGEVACLQDFLDMLSKELGRKVSELVDSEGRMGGLHDRLISERNLLREAQRMGQHPPPTVYPMCLLFQVLPTANDDFWLVVTSYEKTVATQGRGPDPLSIF